MDYFVECPLYDHIRHLIQPYIVLLNNNLDLLVNGTIDLDVGTNKRLFHAVSSYIEQSKHFWNYYKQLCANTSKLYI